VKGLGFFWVHFQLKGEVVGTRPLLAQKVEMSATLMEFCYLVPLPQWSWMCCLLSSMRLSSNFLL